MHRPCTVDKRVASKPDTCTLDARIVSCETTALARPQGELRSPSANRFMPHSHTEIASRRHLEAIRNFILLAALSFLRVDVLLRRLDSLEAKLGRDGGG
jgi:hypothetical protein